MVGIVADRAASFLHASARIVIFEVVVRTVLHTSLSSYVDVVEGRSCVGTDLNASSIVGVSRVRTNQNTLTQRSVSQQIHALVANLNTLTDRCV